MAKIQIKNARLSFPSLFKKAVFEGNETKYEATLLLDKEEHADLKKQLQSAMKKFAEDKYGKGNIPAKFVYPIQDGDEKIPDGKDEPMDGYAGCWSLKAANNRRPTVIDRDKTPLTADDDKPYAGCYVNAVIDFWIQDNKFGKKLHCNLLGIQFYRDGEPFGSAGATPDDFDDYDDDAAFDDFEDDDEAF